MIRKAIIIAALLAFGAAWADMEWQTAIGQKDQVTSGLVAYWAMRNSGTTVYDEYGSNNGTASNGVTFATTHAAVGYGASFDGANDYISIADANSLDFAANVSFTMTAWFKCGASPGNYPYFYAGRQAGNTLQHGIGIIGDGGANNGQARFESGSGGLTSSNTFLDSSWHFIVGIADRSNGSALYVDGVLQNSTTNKPTANLTLSSARSIGAGLYSGSATYCFNGQIDEVRIYNRALTADEIKQLYRMGAIPKGIK
jgi:hypothetical protein